MHSSRTTRFLSLVIATAGITLTSAQAIDLRSLQTNVCKANASLRDLRAVMVVTDINKGNAGDINPAYRDIGAFQKANVYYRRPDKYRVDGVAKGMAIAYVVSGHNLQLIVPGIAKRSEDIARKAGKWRTSLDMGFINDYLWRLYNVAYVRSDKGAYVLRLTPRTAEGKRYELIWVDPNNLRLLKRQRYNGGGELKVRYVYGAFHNAGKLPIAQESKMYGPNGDYLGTIAYRELKVNCSLAPSLFSLMR